ncbi:hypothetical protein NEMBOFW57_007011 [Staphylotrichum longicolle]|uniref:Thiaminase-2/PQQC domain-containing protein n=1 Tax=Staphylotrichum longicolle TaxID=669026 RepID=A0AAD4EUF2_9PEZI|nr:hypothetical protein NEMBOFW57_007011 [Staphylotrichum longicolle]
MASPRESWSLTEHLLSTQEQLYKSATQHPFLLAGAEGRLPKDLLSRWLANDRLYIHSYIRAAGTLLASIDLPRQVPGSQDAFETQLADWLIEALVAIRKEERFFIDVADRYGLGIELAPESQLPGLTLIQSIFSSIAISSPTAPSSSSPTDTPSKLPGLALVQSLFTTTTTATGPTPPPLLPWLEGALTFWGTERCYLGAWSWARDKAEERRSSSGDHDDDGHAEKEQDADGGALRREFIPNWSSPEFAEFVDKLGRLIDAAVAGALAGKEGEELERVRGEILGRVEGKWRTLLEAERLFWPDV